MHSIDWPTLDRLRAAFLAGTAGAQDYWTCERDLENYDQTFAARIGWKWDYVLGDLVRRGWSPPAGLLVDWGCGTGIASRRFWHHFGPAGIKRLLLCDRSPLAMKFAARRIREMDPAVPVWSEAGAPPQVDLLLLSHVVTELTEPQQADLLALARTATSVIWVEPGSHAASRQLIAVREKLRGVFQVVAPCPHRARCGMLEPANGRHWCHHFAPSPPAVFMDGNWTRFARLAGIDLRSLPVSFLVLDKRVFVPPPSPVRVIGAPRVYKAHALVLGCEAAGVRERQLTRRRLPEQFRRLKKGDCPAWAQWECAGDEIVTWK